jgi:hypothetical protein
LEAEDLTTKRLSKLNAMTRIFYKIAPPLSLALITLLSVLPPHTFVDFVNFIFVEVLLYMFTEFHSTSSHRGPITFMLKLQAHMFSVHAFLVYVFAWPELAVAARNFESLRWIMKDFGLGDESSHALPLLIEVLAIFFIIGACELWTYEEAVRQNR